MAISRVPGYSLLSNLDRQGTDLQFTSSTNSSPNNTGSTLLYMDFAAFTVGINELNPTQFGQSLVVTGNILANTGHILTSGNLQYDLGNVTNYWRTIYAANITVSTLTASNVSGQLTNPNQPYITSLGILTSLNVSGNILASNIVGTLLTNAQPNITTIGTLGNLNVTGNILTTNIIASNVTGTLLTNAQPNITSVGTLGNLTVIGNVTVGNLTIRANSTINAGNNVINYVGYPVTSTDAATKAYVDAQISGANSGNTIPLGTPTDTSLIGNNAAYLGFTTATTVTDAIDILNSVTQNLFTNTFVRSVGFTANTTAGGAGQAVLLTLIPQGNINQYTISWGDGTANTVTSSTTSVHTYATNAGTPFTVAVTATNTNGAYPSNVAASAISGYITIYGANPSLGQVFYNTTTNGTALTGNNLYAIQGNVIYLLNTSTNTNTATVTWSINWGDGNTTPIATNSSPGGVLGGNIGHIFTSNSQSGSYGVNLALLTDNVANPAILPLYSNVALKVYANVIAPPAGLNTKVLSFVGSVGTNPTLSASAVDNTGGTSYTANAVVNRTVATGTTLVTTAGNVTTSFAYTANVGNVSAVFNGALAGNVNLAATSTSTISGNLGLIAVSDFNLLTSAGVATTFATSTYYPGLYYGFEANVVRQGGAIPVGINRFGMNHTTTGVVGNVEFIKDDVTAAPTVTAGALAVKAPGTYRYISGIPYFNTGTPQLWWQNITLNSWIGQTWNNTANVVFTATGYNLEGSTGNVILANTHAYVNLSNSSAAMLSSGTPIAGTGNTSPYATANLTIAINQASVRAIANLTLVATNVNGTGTAAFNTTANIQVHTAAQSGISEIAISANTSANTNPAVRSTYFLANTIHTPAYARLTNFMTTPNVYTETADPGVQGTKEATIRLGVLKWSANNYSTGYLPVGPDRSSDGTSYQYFTMGFQRTGVSNFNLNIIAPAGIAGLWVAAPGTTIDTTSGLNGWLTASTSYAGSGVPGSNTGAGGNGSDGCGSGALISANVALSGTYTMTLGTVSMSTSQWQE